MLTWGFLRQQYVLYWANSTSLSRAFSANMKKIARFLERNANKADELGVYAPDKEAYYELYSLVEHHSCLPEPASETTFCYSIVSQMRQEFGLRDSFFSPFSENKGRFKQELKLYSELKLASIEVDRQIELMVLLHPNLNPITELIKAFRLANKQAPLNKVLNSYNLDFALSLKPAQVITLCELLNYPQFSLLAMHKNRIALARRFLSPEFQSQLALLTDYGKSRFIGSVLLDRPIAREEWPSLYHPAPLIFLEAHHRPGHHRPRAHHLMQASTGDPTNM